MNNTRMLFGHRVIMQVTLGLLLACALALSWQSTRKAIAADLYPNHSPTKLQAYNDYVVPDSNVELVQNKLIRDEATLARTISQDMAFDARQFSEPMVVGVLQVSAEHRTDNLLLLSIVTLAATTFFLLQDTPYRSLIRKKK